MGIALFLSIFVMGPTFTQINDQALQPLLDHKINEETALEAGRGADPRLHVQAG